MIKQSIGKAEYINDLPKKPRECYAEFVLSTEANAKIQSIDPSEALVCTICVPESILLISRSWKNLQLTKCCSILIYDCIGGGLLKITLFLWLYCRN